MPGSGSGSGSGAGSGSGHGHGQTRRSTRPSPASGRRQSVGRQALTKINARVAQGGETFSQVLFGRMARSINLSGKLHVPRRFTITSSVHNESSRLQELVTKMRECLAKLGGATATDSELEGWACLIYESMSAPSRTFHGVKHVFDISVNADSIQTISAFFHDVIYYSIDGGLSPAQAKCLEGIITESDGTVCLSEGDMDEAMSLVIALFGFTLGQTLNPFKGLNEFLSAALAVRCLQNTLTLPYLAQITACIEATIPFRGKDENGVTCSEHLFERLKKANVTFKLGLSDDDLVKATQRAANLANRDVANFRTPERAAFLSNTWNLLPESNISLRHTRVFRISDFTLALKKMTGFFANLNPEVIFTSFRNEPTDEALAQMVREARENLNVAKTYMQCKLLSISVLAALAEETGGDAPIALFLGDLPEPKHISPSIEDHIHVTKPANGVKIDKRVFALLEDGREEESDFDIKHSPLAAFLYGLIGDDGLKESLEFAVYPMDKDNAVKLLDSIPRSAVVEIATSCAMIALTRASALDDLAAKYSG